MVEAPTMRIHTVPPVSKQNAVHERPLHSERLVRPSQYTIDVNMTGLITRIAVAANLAARKPKGSPDWLDAKERLEAFRALGVPISERAFGIYRQLLQAVDLVYDDHIGLEELYISSGIHRAERQAEKYDKRFARGIGDDGQRMRITGFRLGRHGEHISIDRKNGHVSLLDKKQQVAPWQKVNLTPKVDVEFLSPSPETDVIMRALTTALAKNTIQQESVGKRINGNRLLEVLSGIVGDFTSWPTDRLPDFTSWPTRLSPVKSKPKGKTLSVHQHERALSSDFASTRPAEVVRDDDADTKPISIAEADIVRIPTVHPGKK